jgi:F-type H+-transporting ATPase subunit b
MFLLPNGTFFVELAIFLFIVYMIGKYIVPPINKAIEERQAFIKSSLESASDREAEAAAMQARYQEQLAEARTEAGQIRAQAQSDKVAMVEDAKREAADAAAQVNARAEAALEVERATAVSSLRQEVGALAVTLAGKVVGESLEDDARARAMVDRFIADLEAHAGQAGR